MVDIRIRVRILIFMNTMDTTNRAAIAKDLSDSLAALDQFEQGHPDWRGDGRQLEEVLQLRIVVRAARAAYDAHRNASSHSNDR